MKTNDEIHKFILERIEFIASNIDIQPFEKDARIIELCFISKELFND